MESTIQEIDDPKIRRKVLTLQLIRDNDVGCLESQARHADEMALVMNGKEARDTHLKEAYQFRLRAESLKRQPINFLGRNFYTDGRRVYSLN